MKTARRLILALLFCIALLTGVHSAAYADTLPPVYSETNVSGTWGDLTWTLDDEGTLTISGSGSMDDFGSRSDEAWLSNRSAVKAVVIEPGVTSIGDYAFYNCSGLTSVAIPSSATRIGSSAFYNCSGLNAVYTDDLAAWCQIVFSGSSANPISYAHSNSGQRHQHRRLCLLRLQRADECDHPGQRHQHRQLCLLRLQRAERSLYR